MPDRHHHKLPLPDVMTVAEFHRRFGGDAEHREVERVLEFSKNEQGYTLVKNVNGGVDIEGLFLNA